VFPLRFALVGAGNIAATHAAAIQSMPGASLVAVATRHPERGPAFAARYGAEWHADYAEALARPDVNVVAICTPQDLHAPITLAAAQAGKHVLCEKPMARNAVECDAMLAACAQAGVTLGVIFQSRFDPLVRRCRELLQSGRLGRLVWANARTLWYRDAAYFQSAPWRGQASQGGGVLINQAIHDIDLLIWLAGLPARVTAQLRTLVHAVEIEDAAQILLEYPGGAIGAIQAATVAFPGYPERLEFFGTDGAVILHKGEGRLDWHFRDSREDGSETAPVSSGATAALAISALGHIAQYHDFAAALREARPPLVDGHAARQSMLLLDAIYRSARSGQPELVVA
jgi:predicted dehydrogenase